MSAPQELIAQLIGARLKLRARSGKPGLLGRSSAPFVSATDRREARLCGQADGRAAVQGAADQMVTLVRQAGPRYRSTVQTYLFRTDSSNAGRKP